MRSRGYTGGQPAEEVPPPPSTPSATIRPRADLLSSPLERLAQAVLDGRVTITSERWEGQYGAIGYTHSIHVDPEPEEPQRAPAPDYRD